MSHPQSGTDATLAAVVEYAWKFEREHLSAAAEASTVAHIVDTVAVSIAGYDSEPARMASRLAATTTSSNGATVWSTGTLSAPELAAFANTIMVRTQDWNDGMQAKGGGHPSDMTPGVLALAEIAHASGAEAMVAVALAYELLGGLGADVPIGDLGLDQGTFMGVAVALAGGRLLGLDRAQLANAASLALAPNIPLGVSRWGALSMMKGCATAFAIRSGVFAVLLAREGFTSSDSPFEGIYGLQHLTGAFEPRLPVLPGGPSVVEMSHQKPIPAETQALGLLELVPRLRAWSPVADIESIELHVSHHVAEHIADPPKFDPRTRETADHSLPYMLAAALVDGGITLGSYRPDRFLDPALRPLMNKMTIVPTQAYSDLRANGMYGVTRPAPARLIARRADGDVFSEEVIYFKGHMRDPMTRADIDMKLDLICAGVLADAHRDRIREAWWNIAAAPDIADLITLLTRPDLAA